MAILGWVFAFYLAAALAETVSHALAPYISSSTAQRAVGWIAVFFIALLVWNAFAQLLKKFASLTGLGFIDRGLGGLFGLLRGLILLLCLTMIITSIASIRHSELWQQATLAPLCEMGVSIIKPHLPDALNAYF
jgi:membrane protein required for colicin V production